MAKLGQKIIARAAHALRMPGNVGMIPIASEIMRRSGQGTFCRTKPAARELIRQFVATLADPEPVKVRHVKRPRPIAAPALRRASPKDFYWSDEWRAVRYVALRRSRGVCELCASGPQPGKPLHVDHIKPRSKYPELELDPTNLQVLCADCNLGKSNTDEIDWRRLA